MNEHALMECDTRLCPLQEVLEVVEEVVFVRQRSRAAGGIAVDPRCHAKTSI